MRHFVVTLVIVLQTAASSAADLPDIVKKEIAEDTKDCDKPETKDLVSVRDVNGDGRPDYILDFGHLLCDGQTQFCGSGGCLLKVFVAMPNGQYRSALEQLTAKFSFRNVHGRPAVVLGFTHAEHDFIYYWNGSEFAERK